MKIGIIAEGHSDRAVIVNILHRLIGIDINDIIPIRPVDIYDETDLANIPKEQFGGWDSVKKECERKELIPLFFERLGNNFLTIHIDTAESAQYGIVQPTKDQNYCKNLRELVIAKIIEWMGIDISKSLLFAIAIEEIDAWILTLMEDRDSSKSANAKKRLEYLKGYKLGKMKPNYELYYEFSEGFKNSSDKQMLKFRHRNESLDMFCEEVLEKTI